MPRGSSLNFFAGTFFDKYGLLTGSAYSRTGHTRDLYNGELTNNLLALLAVTLTCSRQDKCEETLMAKLLTHFTVLRLVSNEYATQGGRSHVCALYVCNTSHLSELKRSCHCRASLSLAMFDSFLYILVLSCRRHVR